MNNKKNCKAEGKIFLAIIKGHLGMIAMVVRNYRKKDEFDEKTIPKEV